MNWFAGEDCHMCRNRGITKYGVCIWCGGNSTKWSPETLDTVATIVVVVGLALAALLHSGTA